MCRQGGSLSVPDYNNARTNYGILSTGRLMPQNLGQFMYFKKFDTAFNLKLNRLVRVMLSNWR